MTDKRPPRPPVLGGAGKTPPEKEPEKVTPEIHPVKEEVEVTPEVAHVPVKPARFSTPQPKVKLINNFQKKAIWLLNLQRFLFIMGTAFVIFTPQWGIDFINGEQDSYVLPALIGVLVVAWLLVRLTFHFMAFGTKRYRNNITAWIKQTYGVEVKEVSLSSLRYRDEQVYAEQQVIRSEEALAGQLDVFGLEETLLVSILTTPGEDTWHLVDGRGKPLEPTI